MSDDEAPRQSTTIKFEPPQQQAHDGAVHKEEGEKHGRCFTWMNSHRLGWLARISGEWPRTIALIFGVVIPLFVLIAVSLLLGFGLAKLEAPSEIEANNDIIARRAVIATSISFHGNVTAELPRICLQILAENNSTDDDINATLEEHIDEIFLRVISRIATNATKPVNNNTAVEGTEFDELLTTNGTLELLEFMTKCGKLGYQIANQFESLEKEETEYVVDDLTFNWIRCDGLGRNSSSSLGQQIWGRPLVDRSQLKPDVQAADAIARWRENAKILYNYYFEELMLENETSPAEARIEAYQFSVEKANGFGHCYANSAAGAWFWFTIMTTIGYGNTAPSTQGGRAMIYTLGFFSILLFAIILGAAGTIVVAIWDDFINRTKIHQLSIPWVACIFWGFCYYAWMLVIAAVTQNWKKSRLDDDMEFSEAYWFSYISTTTVGLGDYYLEHDVILRQDLFVFPIMFLTGFVLLANFFVKLTEVIASVVPRNRPTLEETLAKSDAPCLPKFPHERLIAMGIAQSERLKAISPLNFRRRIGEADRDEEGDEMVESVTAGPEVATGVEAGNSDVMRPEMADPHNVSVPMEVGDGWKGTVTGVVTS